MLGAHFAPRAYVERLVRPTIEEPLREEWENVQAAARKLRLDEKAEEARKLVHEFLRKLCGLRVLDPACGTGNFLYVALDLFKRIEAEVLALLRELGEVQEKLLIEGERVTPKQFLGIEVKPWAKEIADLVLWIGYLQWHYKSHGKGLPPAEPVLMAGSCRFGRVVIPNQTRAPANPSRADSRPRGGRKRRWTAVCRVECAPGLEGDEHEDSLQLRHLRPDGVRRRVVWRPLLPRNALPVGR